jgi:hypothetical protein
MQTRLRSAFGFILIFFVVGACSSDGENQDHPTESQSPDEATETVEATDMILRSVQAMEALSSFRMEFTFRPQGDPVKFLTDFARPNHYYERMIEPVEDGTFEIILYKDSIFGRECANYPDDCEDWNESKQTEDEPYPVPAGGGFTTVAPETLGITALEFIETPRILATQEADEATRLVHISGSIGLGELIIANQRRVYGNVKEYRESCESISITGNRSHLPLAAI